MQTTATEKKLYDLLIDPINGIGYRIVRIRYMKNKGATLQIMIEHLEGDHAVTLEDCEKVSRYVSSLLDVEDPITGAYNLEVSSPGLDRPLVFEEDFEAYKGNMVQVKTQKSVDNSRTIKGLLLDVQEGAIRVQPHQKVTKIKKDKQEEAVAVTIAFDNIIAANLVAQL